MAHACTGRSEVDQADTDLISLRWKTTATELGVLAILRWFTGESATWGQVQMGFRCLPGCSKVSWLETYNEWNEQCCLAAELPRSRCLESLGGENSKRAVLPHPRIEGTLVLLTPWVSGLVPHVFGWKVWSQCKVLRTTKPIL